MWTWGPWKFRSGAESVYVPVIFFPDPQIVQSLIAQLAWTHFLHVIRLDNPLAQEQSY